RFFHEELDGDGRSGKNCSERRFPAKMAMAAVLSALGGGEGMAGAKTGLELCEEGRGVVCVCSVSSKRRGRSEDWREEAVERRGGDETSSSGASFMRGRRSDGGGDRGGDSRGVIARGAANRWRRPLGEEVSARIA